MQPFGVLKSIIYERKNNPINLKSPAVKCQEENK